MSNKKIIAFCVSLFYIVPTVQAEDGDDLKDQFNPVMTAITSQSIAADARAAGMGDIGAATDPDVNSQSWNPAKYPFTISRAGLAINYTPWLRQLVNDIALLNATGYVRIGDYQAVSGSLRYFSLGDVSADDGNMTVKPYELSVDVAYSRMLSEKFSAAVALRYMYSDLSGHYDDNTTPGSAFAADIACYYNNYVMMGSRECQLGIGLNISNIGTKINYGEDYSYFIPTNLRLGFSYMIPVNEYNRFAISADINKLLVPSKPLQGADESNEEYEERLRGSTTTWRPFRASSRVSATPSAVSRAKWKRYNGASVPNTSTTTSSVSARATTTRARCRATANTSRWVRASA